MYLTFKLSVTTTLCKVTFPLFVTTIVYVILSPAATFVSDVIAFPFTNVAVFSTFIPGVLSVGIVSSLSVPVVVPSVAVAVFTIVAFVSTSFCVTSYSTVYVLFAPGAKLSIVSLKLDTKSSVTTTLCNVTFPVFVTTIVYTTLSPATAFVSVVMFPPFTDVAVFSTSIPGSAFSGVTSAVSSFPGVTGVVAVAVFFSRCWLSMSSCCILYVAVSVFVVPAGTVTVCAIALSPSYNVIFLSFIMSFIVTSKSSLPVFFSSILKYAVSPTFSVTFLLYSPFILSLTVFVISKFAVFVSVSGIVVPTVAMFLMLPSTAFISTVNVSSTVSPAGTVTFFPTFIVASSISSPATSTGDTNFVFAGIVSFITTVASTSPVFLATIVYFIWSPIFAGPSIGCLSL